MWKKIHIWISGTLQSTYFEKSHTFFAIVQIIIWIFFVGEGESQTEGFKIVLCQHK